MNRSAGRPSTPARACSRAAAALAICLLCGADARTQDVTEPSLKAAFVYNVAKFTEWPADSLPPAAAFTACVLNDPRFGAALERSVKNRLLWGHSIIVSRVEVAGPLRSCHLLYMAGVTAVQIAAIMASVHGAPVLTISDVDDFSRLGGMARIFVENGKMRFDINLDLARRSRLQLSSKLLTLAARVHDEPGVPQR